MYFVLIFLVITMVLLAFLYKSIEVDIMLKYYELCGKKVETMRGQVVWITGASSGIGEHLAYKMASVGCKLVLSSRRKEELERVKTKCLELASKKLGDVDMEKDFLVLPLDLTRIDTHEEAVQNVLDHFGKIDVLVNNGGRSQRAIIVNTEFKVDQEILELNVIGTISLTKFVLPHMIKRNAGQIVVVSSIAGKVGAPTSATYSAAKFALQGYFFALRCEVYHNGIDVSIVCPGPIKSAIVQNAFSEISGKSVKETSFDKEELHKMETDKFVKYMTIAMANKLDECWISPRPVIFFAYTSQYMPVIFNWFFKRCGLQMLRKSRYNKEKKEN